MSENSPLIASTHPISGIATIDIEANLDDTGLDSNIQENVTSGALYNDQEGGAVNSEDSGEEKFCLTRMCEQIGHCCTPVMKCVCWPCILISNVILGTCSCMFACTICLFECMWCCYCRREGLIDGTQSCLKAFCESLQKYPQKIRNCISDEIKSWGKSIEDYCKKHKIIATLIFIFVILISPILLVIAIVVCILYFFLLFVFFSCCCLCVCCNLLADHGKLCD